VRGKLDASSVSSSVSIGKGITESIQCLGYGLYDLGSTPDRGKRFIYSPKCPHRVRGPPSFLFDRYRGSFPGVKQAGVGGEVDHSPPSSAKYKNEWSYTSALRYALRA
jgi:hypothetical protein